MGRSMLERSAQKECYFVIIQQLHFAHRNGDLYAVEKNKANVSVVLRCNFTLLTENNLKFHCVQTNRRQPKLTTTNVSERIQRKFGISQQPHFAQRNGDLCEIENNTANVSIDLL